MTAPDLLAAFTQLTGIRFAIGAHYQQAQAIELARAGFTVRDLELVILWTKKQIAGGKSGLKPLSLQWRVLMGAHGDGSEYVCFQERLGLARAEVAKGWRPPYKLTKEQEPAVVRPERATQSAAEYAAIAAKTSTADWAQLKEHIAGKRL